MESTISTNPRYCHEHKDSSFLSYIFMAYIETHSLSKTVFKPTVWKRYIDDIFSPWGISKPDISWHREKTILDHDVKTHFKRKPYSIYIFSSYHPPIVKAPVWQTRSLENPTNKLLWGSISDFKSAWWTEASHTILKEKLLLEVKLTERKAALLKKKNNQEEKDWNIAFRDTIPALSVYKKEALMKKWNLIQNQPLPCQNFKEPPKVLFLWERKIMAQDMLVRAKT